MIKILQDPEPLLLIDADIPLYKSSFSVEQVWDWTDDVVAIEADITEAELVFDMWIDKVVKAFPRSYTPILCFSGHGNYRKTILQTYKANRAKKRKPVLLKSLREIAEEKYLCMSLRGLEADDLLGLLSESGIMISIDKDLRTIPGMLYNPDKPEDGVELIDKEQADYNHLYQTLVGDYTDGYSGCPRVGPMRASNILRKDNSWEAVVEAYKSRGLDEEDALVQARVARILRPGEYDFQLRKPKLWSPNEYQTN